MVIAAAAAAGAVAGGAIAIANVPLFINTILPEGNTVDEILRLAATRSGQVLAVMTGAMSAASLAGGWLCKRFGYRLPTVLGLLIVAGGFGLMGTWVSDMPYNLMALHLAVAGLGFGLVTSPLSTIAVDAVGETQRGVASGLVVILRLIGMSVGLSLLTAWVLQRFDQLSSGYTIAQLGEVITNLTAQVLTEIFLVSAGVLLLAVPIAFFLKKKMQNPS